MPNSSITMSSTMRKHLMRVRQIADQTFLRGEKTDVLTKDLAIVEKRVDLIKQSCQSAGKKISACLLDMGSETSTEKRQKKVPQMALAQCMQDCSNNLSQDSVLGIVLGECASAQFAIGNELLSYQTEVEKDVLNPIINILENDIHNISKLRKQLGKLAAEMDLAKTRYQTAVRHSQQATTSGTTSANKIELLRDELEDSSQRVDQSRDALATEMFTLISQEPYLSKLFLQWHHLQIKYHRSVLKVLQAMVPSLEKRISDYPQKPVYGQPLEEHLTGTGREIALVIEECVCFLLEYAINEEGLFRIAGSTSKVKKLKSAFDVGIVDMTEYERDPHAVAGALKSYLRELPEPLMTQSLYDDWLSAAKITEFEPRMQALWQVVHKLPEPFLNNLRYIIKFLAKLTMNAEVNKMSTQNIAIVMAPNLIWAKSLEDDAHLGMNMAVANIHSSLVDTLIMYNDWFFPEDVEFAVQLGTVHSNSTDHLNANISESSAGDSKTVNGETDEYGADVTISTSPTSHSPRVFHRPGKKPAPPAPPQGREKPRPLSDKPSGDHSSFLNVEKAQKNSNLERTNSMRDSMAVQQKPGKSERIVSTLPRNVTMTGERAGRSERPSILRRKSNDNLFNFAGQEKTAASRPDIPEKPVPYSTKSLERPSRAEISDRPPSAPGRSSRASVNGDKSQSAPPEITVIHRSNNQIERPTVPPPERPAKPEKPARPPSLDNSHSFPQLSESVKSDGLDVSSIGLLLDDSNMTKTETVFQATTLDEFDPLGSHKQSGSQSMTGSQAAPQAQVKHDKWDFLITPSSEKPPDRPPRSSPHAHDNAEKSEGSVIRQENFILGPEKPPRCHSPHTYSIQSTDAEKQVTVVQAGPIPTPRVPPSPGSARQKPPRPQPPPPPTKLRISSSMENTHL